MRLITKLPCNQWILQIDMRMLRRFKYWMLMAGFPSLLLVDGSAHAGPMIDPGPGYSVSGYQVVADADILSSTDTGIDSIPGSSATAQIQASDIIPWFASASATGLSASLIATTSVNGGEGAVGAGASSHVNFAVNENHPGDVTSFQVTLAESFTLEAIPLGMIPGLATFSWDSLFAVSSDMSFEDAQVNGNVQGSSTQTLNATDSGFDAVYIDAPQSDNGPFSLTAYRTITINASNSLSIFIDAAISTEVLDAIGEGNFDVNVFVTAMSNSPIVDGPIPLPTGSIPVPGAEVPEPGTISLMLIASVCAAYCFWRSSGSRASHISEVEFD